MANQVRVDPSTDAFSHDSTQDYCFPLSAITALFFMFGFLTCLNDILVPHLKTLFALTYTQATLVQFCFFTAYFFMSIPSGKIIHKIGYKSGMIAGLLVTAVGALGFLPATHFKMYWIFLLSLFVLATGITLLQVAVNPYVTLLGHPKTASSRLNLVQAFNALGTTVAPMIGTFFILSSTAGAESIQKPYLVFSIVLLAIAFAMSFIPLPRIEMSKDAGRTELSLLKNPNVLRGSIGIFCYVGAEVAIGSFLINWMGEQQLGALDTITAGNYVSFYWGAAMVGRFLGTTFLMKFNPARILFFAGCGTILLTLTSMFTEGNVALYSILGVGLFNSIMFPTIFSLGLDGMKQRTAEASGLLCTAIVGGALFPLVQGIFADQFGLKMSFIIPILGYLYILHFANYKIKNSTYLS